MKIGEDFSIILMGLEDDEEVVIQAGIVEKPVQDKDGETLSHIASSGGSTVHISQDTSKATLKEEDFYRTITEEDLAESGPFNKMRLIILIGGLLLLLGFILYFLFLR